MAHLASAPSNPTSPSPPLLTPDSPAPTSRLPRPAGRAATLRRGRGEGAEGLGEGVSLAAAAELFNSTGNLESSRKEYWGVLRSLCRHLEGGRLVWNCPYRFVAAKSVSPAERRGGWLAPG